MEATGAARPFAQPVAVVAAGVAGAVGGERRATPGAHDGDGGHESVGPFSSDARGLLVANRDTVDELAPVILESDHVAHL